MRGPRNTGRMFAALQEDMRREDQDLVGEDPDLSGVGENLEEDSPVEESTSKQK